jgi:uncharacterized membrane protein YcaP (DUF421 family)
MDYLVVLWRAVTLIPLFLVVSLIMGKRHIGELAVFDLVITVTLGAVAGADLADPNVPHSPTLFAIVLLGGIHFLLSRYILRSRKIGHWVTMDPTIMIQHGVIRWDSLAKLRYSVDQLLSHLREKDVFDLSDVEYAVLEPNGALSVLKKADRQTVTVGDAGLKPTPAGLPVPVVLEGRVHRQGLEALGRDRSWLSNLLQSLGYKDPREVFLAMVDKNGNLYVSPLAQPTDKETLAH